MSPSIAFSAKGMASRTSSGSSSEAKLWPEPSKASAAALMAIVRAHPAPKSAAASAAASARAAAFPERRNRRDPCRRGLGSVTIATRWW
jgi:hypothetical protein